MMGSWMLVTGLASLFAGDFSGMIPEPAGTTAIVTQSGLLEPVRAASAGAARRSAWRWCC